MLFLKNAFCSTVVSGLVLAPPALASPKAAQKVVTKDVRAASKVKKPQRAADENSDGTIYLVIGGAVVVAGAAAALAASK